MKKIKLTLLALLFGITLVSCEDNRGGNMEPNSVYIVQNGLVKAEVYPISETSTFELGIYKSGFENASAYAEIVISPQAMALYNATNSTNLMQLPENCYTLAPSRVQFGSDQIRAYYSVVFNVPELEEFVETIAANGETLADYAVPLELQQSDVQIKFSKKYTIIQPTMLVAEVMFDKFGEIALAVDKNTKTLVAEIPMSMKFENINGVIATITHDLADFEAFNLTKGGALSLLSNEAYTVSPDPFEIPAGQKRGTLKVSIDMKSDAISYGFYCIPVRIASLDDENISPKASQSTAFITFSTLLTIDRSTWSVIDFSSQEESGEGTNGFAELAIDNDNTTYWHSQWQASAAVPPHTITIDMGVESILGAVVITPRNLSEQAGVVSVSSSPTGPWVEVGTFKTKDKTEDQVFPVLPTQCRYFKLTVSSTNAMISEIRASGGPIAE